jgi:hypothetical protein
VFAYYGFCVCSAKEGVAVSKDGTRISFSIYGKGRAGFDIRARLVLRPLFLEKADSLF